MCTENEKCTCFVGYVNQYCNETASIENLFAGYSIVSRAGIYVTERDINTTGNIATTSSLLRQDSPFGIYVNDGLVIHEQDSFASNLVTQAMVLFDPSRFTPIYDFILNDGSIPYLEVKSGGTYKLTAGWKGPSKVVISTVDRVIFAIFGDNFVSENVEVVFTECASPYNLYWIVDKTAKISGNFKGNLIARSITASNAVITGTIFSISTTVNPILKNVSFTPLDNFDPYKGFSIEPQCSFTYCYGIESRNSSVCAGIGNCVGYDSCSCPNGYGFDCSVGMCNGVLSTDSSVCSGHGTCSSNICSCDSGFSGSDCSITTCNGILNSNNASCNSNGLCKYSNTCICKIGYKGTYCNEIETRPVISPLAGYSIILSGSSIYLKSLKYIDLSGSIAIVGSKIEPTSYYHPSIWGEILPTNYYRMEGAAKLHKNDWEANQAVSTALSLVQKLSALPCNYTFGLNVPNLYINQGGVYCFPNGWIGPSKVVINGPERVVFKTGYLNYNNFEVTMISNASPSSVFWIATQFLISGDFKGTLMAPYGDIVSGSKITGTISRGSCIGPNICNCSNGYYGSQCEFTTCYSVPMNSSSVCSGNGTCYSFNNCTCFTGFYDSTCSCKIGTDCTIRNTSYIDNSTVVSNTTNWNVTSNSNSTNTTSPTNTTVIVVNSNCTSSLNCSGHGVCKNSKCSCYSTSTAGYWTGYWCNQCKPGYYGDQCLTYFGSTVRITADFKGLQFYMYSPPNKTDVKISCSKLLFSVDVANNLYGLERDISCSYVDKTSGLFMITFGSFDFTVYPGSTIKLNMLVFDNVPAFAWNSFTVAYPQNMTTIAPVAALKIPPLDTFSSCDAIPVDGSLSYSVDRKPLKYYWSVVNASSMTDVFAVMTAQPNFMVSAELAPGSYKIKLQVYSVYLNKFSTPVYSKTFTKATKPLPSLSIFKDETIIERFTYQFPLTIRKSITTSSCQSEFDKVEVEWKKESGSAIEFKEDSYNNLVIPGVKYFEESTYIFKVSAFYSSDPSLTVSTTVRLNVLTPNITLGVLQLEAKGDHTLLKVDYSDPETLINSDIVSVWTWSCIDHSSQKLLSFLQSVSESKSTIFNVTTQLFDVVPSSIHLRLKVEKFNGKSLTKDTIINFNNIPPLVNVINIEPKSSVVVRGQLLTVQVLVSSSAISAISNSVVWTLDAIKVDKSQVSEQTLDDKRTSTVYIDTSNLVEGSEHFVSLFTYDASKGTSSESSYGFQIAVSPKPCECAVLPPYGSALDTDFNFICYNCKSEENHIDLRYGFIDDRSGLKVPLYNLGEVYSSKLPAPFEGSKLTCFFEMVDTTTGAFTTVYKDVKIEKPVVSEIEQVQNFVKLWSELSTYYSQEGEFGKSFYQSASTSRTDSVLVIDAFKHITKSSRDLSIICQNGYDLSGVCKCQDGYIGRNCDISIRDFSNIQKRKLQILNGIISIANNTVVTINDDYVGLLAFAIDSLLVNYPYLNSDTISESLTTLNTFLTYSLGIDGLKVANGVETLLLNCIKSARDYIIDRQYVVDQSSNSAKLLSALMKSSKLIARSNAVGSPLTHFNGPFYSIVLNRHTLFNFPYNIYDNSTLTSVEIEPFVDLNYVMSYISQKYFVYALSVTQDIYSLQSRLSLSHLNEDSDRESSNLISPIVSLSFSDVPVDFGGGNNIIYYNIPINKTHYEQFIVDQLDVTHVSRSFECGNFRDGSSEIRKECTLVSITEEIARCRCSKLTNVFIIETKVSSSVSYLLVAIFLSIVVGLCCIGLFIGLTAIFCYKARQRRKIHDDHIVLCENQSNSSIENSTESVSTTPREKKEKPQQTTNLIELKSNQVVPADQDLVDF
ncbi:predicted protein [Naegleria gruberi]|uniref:Predicted protein n=1 Tax=Naegleria gruberi TaxID=5762 RepID=D2W408_NAEGR|nr:uncharacterized protein NAEGRDRAFT_76139 [Naegleria gruberi]EFC36178.1 predicted protein [Naegleria gruberi]|eukprot:XP_002668922.1 predicted protein [Naegleria gruberi strain NEG-M]